jgi:hypothetical protein
MKHGGTRVGAGRPKGVKNKMTLEKEVAREALRELVMAELEPLVEAQIAHALGVSFLVVRNTKTGKITRVTKAQAKGKLRRGEEIIEVWEKDPSVQAFTDLMNRCIDKPKEQKQEVEVAGNWDELRRT